MFKYRSTSIIIDLRFLFGSVFSILSLALMLFVFPPIEHSTPFVLFSFSCWFCRLLSRVFYSCHFS
jgi:hypothetical protein